MPPRRESWLPVSGLERMVARAWDSVMYFLCHASADKETYVRPFAAALTAGGITYWLDEAEVGWGDRITEKINEGLSHSHYVVVFLTEAFLKRKWPQTELGGAL